MVGRSKKIDDFIVQRGSSAEKAVSDDTISAINNIIGSYDLPSKSFTFGGISGSQNFTISGSALGERTVLSVIDRDRYEEAMGRKLDWAHHEDMSPRLRGFLEKEGINVDSKATGAVMVVSDVFKEHLDKIERLYLHEIGHGASKGSGAYGEVIKAHEDFFGTVARYEHLDKVTLEHAKDMQDRLAKIMRAHGLEEGRAEGFAFQNLEKKLIDIGTPIDDITKIIDTTLDHSGYTKHESFKHYFSKYSPSMQSMYEKLGGDLQNLPSPLTGKTGLTISEMMQDTGSYVRLQAAGAFQGSLEGLSGESGKINQMRMGLYRSEFGRVVNDQLPAERAVGITTSLNQAASDTLADNRSLSIISDAARPAEAKMAGNRPVLSLITDTASSAEAKIVSNRPIISLVPPALVPPTKAAKEVMQTTRSLTRSAEMLDTAAATAARVVERDSIGMRILGAASSVLRRRI